MSLILKKVIYFYQVKWEMKFSPDLSSWDQSFPVQTDHIQLEEEFVIHEDYELGGP